MKDILPLMFGLVVTVFAMVGGILISAAGINYHIENVPVVVSNSSGIIYDGRSACVDIKTSGAATKVSIGTGWLCMFPGEYYVGNDVKVITKKGGSK